MTEKSTGQHWYIARDGKQTGPISDVEINAIAGHGYFREKDLVWRPGLPDWQLALNVFPPQVPPSPVPVAQPVTAKTGPPAPEPAKSLPPVDDAPTVAPPAAPEPRPLLVRPMPQEPKTATRPPPASSPRTLDPVLRSQPRREMLATREPTVVETTARQSTPRSRHTETPASESSTTRPGQPPRRRNRSAVAVIGGCIAVVTAGLWMTAYPDFLAGLPPLGALKHSAATASDPASSAADPSSPQMAAFEHRLQQTAHWPVIKREFPDWYGDRLREVAELQREKKSDDDIAKVLVDGIVALRRQNATQALAASAPKLKALASAFLENLKQLKAQSTTTCYNFISRGETTPGVIDLLQVGDGTPPSLQLQVAAIFDAIGEGRKSPVTHERPQKADYDVLMDQLSKLGWSQTDVATFADPDKLARTEPAKVCQMVQDWFVAHIAIPDAAVQERLLSETLRPVVSG